MPEIDYVEVEEENGEKETKLSAQEILCLIHLCIANCVNGLYYAMLGPFFPQEVLFKTYILKHS